MPVYTVDLTMQYSTEIEATDEDEAHELAIQEAGSDSTWMAEAESNVKLSDNQYTNQQELKDREDG